MYTIAWLAGCSNAAPALQSKHACIAETLRAYLSVLSGWAESLSHCSLICLSMQVQASDNDLLCSTKEETVARTLKGRMD